MISWEKEKKIKNRAELELNSISENIDDLFVDVRKEKKLLLILIKESFLICKIIKCNFLKIHYSTKIRFFY